MFVRICISNTFFRVFYSCRKIFSVKCKKTNPRQYSPVIASVIVVLCIRVDFGFTIYFFFHCVYIILKSTLHYYHFLIRRSKVKSRRYKKKTTLSRYLWKKRVVLKYVLQYSNKYFKYTFEKVRKCL